MTFSEFLKLYQKRYVALSKKMDNISEQRNKIYAHNDCETYGKERRKKDAISCQLMKTLWNKR